MRSWTWLPCPPIKELTWLRLLWEASKRVTTRAQDKLILLIYYWNWECNATCDLLTRHLCEMNVCLEMPKASCFGARTDLIEQNRWVSKKKACCFSPPHQPKKESILFTFHLVVSLNWPSELQLQVKWTYHSFLMVIGDWGQCVSLLFLIDSGTIEVSLATVFTVLW